MASSGSLNTTAYEGRYLTFSWTEKSQDTATNKTVITWTLKGAGGDSTWYKAGNFSVAIAGKTVYTSTSRIQLSNGTVVASGTFTFTHNSDGTKSFTVSVQAGIYTVAVNCTGSKTFTLDTIPRASQPSCVTWPEHTQNVGEFGDTISIHMNRKADVFTHTVRYKYGAQTGTIATGVTNGTTWKIPLDFMDLIPAATKGSGMIYVDTYQGSTLIGTKGCGFTATVPASVKPTCTLIVTDATGLADTYGSPVQSLSKLKIKVNPTLAYSSPIASYTVKANGATYTAAESTTGALKASGTISVTATVKDKRGRTGTATASLTVLAYTGPTISQLTVHRCDEVGNSDDQGDHIRVNFSAAVTALNNKNKATYTLRYKKSAATTYSTVVLTALADTFTVTNDKRIIEADSNSSYDIELEVKDSHGTATRATSASTAFTLLNWGANGTSMGIGKVAEKANALEIALQMYDRFDTRIGNGLAAYGSSGNAIDADTTLEHHFLTTKGTPTTDFWHVLQLFYSSKTETSNRVQLAMPYNKKGALFKRYYINGSGWSAWESEALQAYPVGSIYMAYNHTDPSTLFGGTWVRITETFLWGTSPQGTIGATGGEKNHTLTTEELPEHTHVVTVASTAAGSTAAANTIRYNNENTNTLSDKLTTKSTGGGAAHNNMPPYTQVSIWRRTA